MANRGTTLPPDILVTWPEPNYVNPDNQTAQLMAVEITLCSFTVVIMVLRLYSRGVLTKSIGSDDWLMAAALRGVEHTASQKSRISLILVFALGSVVCVAGIVRIYYLWIVFDPNNWDFTYQGGPLYIVTAIEGDLGILCASLPTLKPLIHRYAPSLLGSAHTRTRPTGHNPSYPLSSYDADRRRDMKRGQTLGMSSYKMTSYVTGPTLSSESEENILPPQGSGGWGPPTSSRDDTSGVSGRAGIGKKVEIEVTVENVPSNSSDELEKPELARMLSRPLSPKRI
ncbi:hypothetical protein Dda_5027 [Drechslerella dactyloides]|uniref:Rhodopsin domain-containing protein n=1 Tax=Drechslerella dactyloides TaxID=74499 RepID=A0AAD6NJS9_DREDA|nr:hypothetical protein Dda_5027 [Drechslerella dactyloides]